MQPGRGYQCGHVEPDYGFRIDERDGLHLHGDSDESVWDQCSIPGIEQGNAGGARVELHLHRTGGRCGEYGVFELHGVAQRRL